MTGLGTRVRAVTADHDRGSEPVSLAILAPVMILFLGLLAVGGRVAIAADSMAGVAGDAARDASISRSAPEAVQVATTTATASLRSAHLHCVGGPTVTVDTSGFSAPSGTVAFVRVQVTCVVAFSDIGMPGLPGSRTLRDQAISPIDPFRSVGLRFSNSPSVPDRTLGDGAL